VFLKVIKLYEGVFMRVEKWGGRGVGLKQHCHIGFSTIYALLFPRNVSFTV